MLDIIRSFLNNSAVQTILALFIGGIITYYSTLKLRRRERVDKCDDEIIESRMAVYRQAEEIIETIFQSEPLPFYNEKCKVYGLVYKMKTPSIPAYSKTFSELNSLAEFKDKVFSLTAKVTLLDYKTWLILRVLDMYIDNYLVVYDGFKSKGSYSLALLAFYDLAVIGNKLVDSIQKFYSSSSKIKIKRNSFMSHISGRLFLYSISRRFLIRMDKKHEKHIAMKVIGACGECEVDCLISKDQAKE